MLTIDPQPSGASSKPVLANLDNSGQIRLLLYAIDRLCASSRKVLAQIERNRERLNRLTATEKEDVLDHHPFPRGKSDPMLMGMSFALDLGEQLLAANTEPVTVPDPTESGNMEF